MNFENLIRNFIKINNFKINDLSNTIFFFNYFQYILNKLFILKRFNINFDKIKYF
jgi:hypothetical protein